MGSALAGFGLSFSLILAIGAQNAFVLRQGLRQEHVFAVCLFCAIADALLICAGVFGFGTLAQRVPGFETIMRYGGALFLLVYGARSFWAAWHGGQALQAAGGTRSRLGATLATLAAITLLNPHVYLDTVVLIGSVSARYDAVPFAVGAAFASASFFFLLGYGARLLAPVFARPVAWRVLDLGIGVVMWAIAVSLIRAA